MAFDPAQYHREYRAKDDKVYKQIRLSKADFATIEAEATNLGMRPATYMAQLVTTRHSQQPVIPKSVTDQFKAFRRDMRGIATNVNQMAHHANSLKKLVDERGLLNRLRDLEKLVIDYTTAKITKP